MHLLDWLIVIIPVVSILWLAIYSSKYVRGVVDFLAADRYVLSAATCCRRAT